MALLTSTIDVVSPMVVEVLMFVLAAGFYISFVGHIPFFKVRNKKKLSTAVAKSGSRKAPEGACAGGHAAMTPLYHALRRGQLGEALDCIAALPGQVLPPQAASRVLTALGKSKRLNQEVMDKLMDLAGRFASQDLEMAAAELQKRNDSAACGRLYRVAGLLSIPRSERAIELLAWGQASNPVALREMLEELEVEGRANETLTGCLASLLARAEAEAAATAITKGGAISVCAKQGDLKGAINAFNSLKQSGSPVNGLAYNRLLDACVHCGDLKAALAYLEEMKALGLEDVVSYNTMIKGHLSHGDAEAARLLLQDMRSRGLAASHATYHVLLGAMTVAGDRRGAWRLLDEMQGEGLTPTAVTLSIFLKTVTARWHGNDLERILGLVDTLGISMDDILFVSVAEACICTGRLDLLSKQLHNCSQSGGLSKLTAPTYGSMIKAYGRAGEVAQVRELWEEMLACHVTPSAVTVGCMVEALVMNDCVDEAWRLAQKLWEDDTMKTSANTVIYSTILKGFAMSKQPEKVTALYEEMKARGVPCNTITYNTMLNALARCGLMHRVPQILEDMRAVEPKVEPDIVTYSTIVKGFCASGDLDKSLELLREMKEEAGLAPDEVMYNSLLDGCAKQQRLEEALRLLKEMRASGVAPSNYTLSILVKLLGRSRRLSQAFALVQEITKEHGFRPNIQVYTCLIQACFHNRQLARALALHDEIARGGDCTPDEKTYTSLARGCLQVGAASKAAEVVRCAYGLPGHGLAVPAGCGPVGLDSKCLDEVLGALGRNSAAAEALKAELQTARGPARCGAGSRLGAGTCGTGDGAVARHRRACNGAKPSCGHERIGRRTGGTTAVLTAPP